LTRKEYNSSVDLFADGLYRFVLKNCKDSFDAEDIVQDVYTKLWEKHSLVEFEKVKSYLFTAAYRTMLDKIKKNKPGSMEQLKYVEPNHETHYSDVNEIIDEALQRLPEIQKAAITLRDYEGYSYEEIGEILDLSESQVKVYIFRGRKALKEYLVRLEYII
jgi:RNA polymerase sigma factor (sigma-70 family)